jgi:DNA-binding GntR family transcriptional regulator
MDERLFRDVIGRFASGVTVISTRSGGTDLGTTASAVSSLSMEPPMLLICMNRSSETGQAIAAEKRFVVNILGEDQAEIAQRFAVKGKDKFTGITIERGDSQLPRIAQALAHLECSVAETAEGGTHLVFLSLVEHARAREGTPLTYYRGQFGRFEETAQEAAYRSLRQRVLNRDLGAGEALDVDQLADELDLERPRVQYALIKLNADGLVERDPDAGWVVTPLEERRAKEAVEVRCMIQTAVAEQVAGNLREPQLAELRAHASAAIDAAARQPLDLEALRIAGRNFHEAFISLAENATLLDVYRRLRIDAIWLRMARGRYARPDYLRTLTDAIETGDVPGAAAALRRHADEVIQMLGETLEDAGGPV